MSQSDGSLANVSESFAAPDLPSVVARKGRKERRQRIEGLALGVTVIVALIVGGVSLTSQREATQPLQDVAERPAESAQDRQWLQLPLTRVVVPTNWHTLVGTNTFQVTNFDAGFDDTLCFGGGKSFPATGVMTAISQRAPQEPTCAGVGVVQLTEMFPFGDSRVTVIAGEDASDEDISYASAVWSRDGVVEDPSRPVPSPARVGPYGPSLILGSGVGEGESWAFTVREGEPRAPGESDVRVLAYGEYDRTGEWHGGDVRMTAPDTTPILVVREDSSRPSEIRAIVGLADPGAAKLSFTGYPDWIPARGTPASAFAQGQPSYVAHLHGMRLDQGTLSEIGQDGRLFGVWEIPNRFLASDEGFEEPVMGNPGVVTLEVILPTDTIRSGSHTSGHVQVTNATGQPLEITTCSSPFQVALVNDQVKPSVGWLMCAQQTTIPTGVSTWPIRVDASYGMCGKGAGLPDCKSRGRIPPLPPGEYRAQLFQSPRVAEPPSPLSVRVVD